jgi:hypothetical protein
MGQHIIMEEPCTLLLQDSHEGMNYLHLFDVINCQPLAAAIFNKQRTVVIFATAAKASRKSSSTLCETLPNDL